MLLGSSIVSILADLAVMKFLRLSWGGDAGLNQNLTFCRTENLSDIEMKMKLPRKNFQTLGSVAVTIHPATTRGKHPSRFMVSRFRHAESDGSAGHPLL